MLRCRKTAIATFTSDQAMVIAALSLERDDASK
jgi:hypothetical protein